MRLLVTLAICAAATMLTAPRAQAVTWCANDGENFACGFVTFQQCLEFAAGNNAFCDVDLASSLPQITSSRSRGSHP